jgi:hypothetical protein
LEFIFENPIAIFFIIAAITSFIKKMKQNSNPNQKQENEPEWKKVLNIPQTLNEGRRVESKPPKEQRQNKSKLAKEYYEIKSNTERNQPKETGRNDAAFQRKEMNKDVRKAELDGIVDLSPNKDTIIDGIVWAEILGPPRAYKSHSQRRATYRR